MKNIHFQPSELPTTDMAVIARLVRRAGYKNAAAGTATFEGFPTEYIVWVEDNVTDTKEQILHAISGLTDVEILVQPSSIDLVADGQSTADILIFGNPETEMKVVYQGSLPISTNSFILNHSGRYTLRIGPFSPGFKFSTPISVFIGPVDKLSKPAYLTVKCH